MPTVIKMFENTERMHDPQKFTRDYHKIKAPTLEHDLHYAEALYYTGQFSECSRFVTQKINTINTDDEPFAILYLKNILGRSEYRQSNIVVAQALFDDIIRYLSKALEEESNVGDVQKINYTRLITRTYFDYAHTYSVQYLDEEATENQNKSSDYLALLKEDDSFKKIISLGLYQNDSLIKIFSQDIMQKMNKNELFNHTDLLALFYIIDGNRRKKINYEKIGQWVDFALKCYQNFFKKNIEDDVVHFEIARLYDIKKILVKWHWDRASEKAENKEYMNQYLEFANKSVKIYTSVMGTNSLWTAAAYNNQGEALSKMERYKEALKCLLTAYSIMREILRDTDSGMLFMQHSSLGVCFFYLKQYNEALKYFDLAISTYSCSQSQDPPPSIKDQLRTVYCYKTRTYIKQKNKDAEIWLVKAYGLDVNRDKWVYYFVRGKLYCAEENYQAADSAYGLAMGCTGNNLTQRRTILISQARLAVLRARKAWQNKKTLNSIYESSMQYAKAEKLYEQVFREYYLPEYVGEYRIGKTYLEHAKLFLDKREVEKKKEFLRKAESHLQEAGEHSHAKMYLMEVRARINAETQAELLQNYNWQTELKLSLHYTYARFSNLVYNDHPQMPSEGKWKPMSNAHDKRLNRDSFWAQAFKSEERREVVIAYRGTDWDIGDIGSDLQIFQKTLAIQFAYAILFFEAILKEYNEEKSDDEPYAFRFTGHSLGGALALYVLYMALYHPHITRLEIPNKLRDNMYAIVFDAAGISDLLEQVEQSPLPMERKLEMKKRVTSYVGNPHFVNAAMGQIGQLIRIHFPDNDEVIQEMCRCVPINNILISIQRKCCGISLYDIITSCIRSVNRFATQHPMVNFMGAFNSTTGRLLLDDEHYHITLVQNWPHGLFELHKYIALATQLKNENAKDNPDNEMIASLEHIAQHDTHYAGNAFSAEGIQFIGKDQLELSIWENIVKILSDHAEKGTKIEKIELENSDNQKKEEAFFALTSYITKNDRLCSIVLPASALVIIANRVANNYRAVPTAVPSTHALQLYPQVNSQEATSLSTSLSTSVSSSIVQHRRQNQITPLPMWTAQNGWLTASEHFVQLPPGLILGIASTDGNCLFDSIAKLINDHRDANAMRQLAVAYMRQYPNQFITYFSGGLSELNVRITQMDGTLTHGDDAELHALALVLNRQIIVFSNDNPVIFGEDTHSILFLRHRFHNIGRNQFGHYEPVMVGQGVDVNRIRSDFHAMITRQVLMRNR